MESGNDSGLQALNKRVTVEQNLRALLPLVACEARIATRVAEEKGRADDLELLGSIAHGIAGNTICALGDAAAMPVQSFLKKFKDEFLRHTVEHRCPFGESGWGLDQTSRPAVVGAVRY